MATGTTFVFDLDGTLVDSDDALVAPFLALGVPPASISFGHAIAPECRRLGISMDRYVELYDTAVVQPFPGVVELLASLPRWAVCSNKHPVSARTELARLGWTPSVAMFSDAFGWGHKHLGPVLDALGVAAADVVMVGDSDGDRRCASEVGCRYIWAGWNPRVRTAGPDGVVLERPAQLLELSG